MESSWTEVPGEIKKKKPMCVSIKSTIVSYFKRDAKTFGRN